MKDTIRHSARSVFSRKGYRATTVSDILAEAGVARGTFYRYFTNKRHVFYDILAELFAAIYEAASAMVPSGDSHFTERVEDSFAQCYRLFVDNRGVLLAYMREGINADPGLYALWDDFDRRMILVFTDVLSRGAAAGELRQVDSELVSRAMLMLFLQVPYRDIMMGQRVDLDVQGLAAEMVHLLLDGLLLRDGAQGV